MSTASKKVVVFDYGFGTVRSAERALARTGAEVEITRDFDKAMNADGLLVPGVGAFAACMQGLREARGDWIIDRRLSGGRPVMGICVGMQILFGRGIEHGVETEGLDEWPGTVDGVLGPKTKRALKKLVYGGAGLKPTQIAESMCKNQEFVELLGAL